MPLRFADNAGNYFDLARRFWLTNLTKERFKFNFIRSPLGSIPSKERERERERDFIIDSEGKNFRILFRIPKRKNFKSDFQDGDWSTRIA